MKKSDFRLIGLIGTILGAIFLVAGLYAASYYELTLIWGGYTHIAYPYAQYSGGLVISGIVLLIVGLCMLIASKATPTPA